MSEIMTYPSKSIALAKRAKISTGCAVDRSTGRILYFESLAEMRAFNKANRSKWTKWGKSAPHLN